jgi:hypothetical protein
MASKLPWSDCWKMASMAPMEWPTPKVPLTSIDPTSGTSVPSAARARTSASMAALAPATTSGVSSIARGCRELSPVPRWSTATASIPLAAMCSPKL